MLKKLIIGFIVLLFALSTFAQESKQEEVYSIDTKDLVVSKAISLPKPSYPPLARQARIVGRVNVKIIINSKGEVVFAKATSGNNLFHQLAEAAAMMARFTPSTINGKPVSVSASVVYNFAREDSWESVGYTLGTIEQERAGYGFTRKSFNLNMQGLEAEKEELLLLTENETIEGKPKRAKNLIENIKTKLSKISPIDEWYFKLGLLTSNVSQFSSRAGKDEDFVKSFVELRKLINFPPPGILEERLSYLRAIIRDVKENEVTKEQKAQIINSLTRSFNMSINDF